VRGGTPSLFGLAPGGVYPAASVTKSAVRSYFKLPAFAFGRTFSPLPSYAKASDGGIFSVALSLGSLPAGITRHLAHMEPGLSSPAGFRIQALGFR